MFDTQVTLVGNVMTAPEWRRTSVTNALVANFKVASSSRRYDRDNGRWVDGPSLRVRVTCWRRLAEGVASSVMVGDPVIVTGRMYTRDWVAEDGTKRASYELDAVAVGHDLARGRGKFSRTRLNTVTSTVENAESDARIAGETSQPVDVPTAPPEEHNPLFDDFSDAELGLELPHAAMDPHPARDAEAAALDAEAAALDAEAAALDAEAMLREAGLGAATDEPVPLDGFAAADPDDPDAADRPDSESDGEPTGEPVDGPARPERGRRGRGRVSVPA